MRLAVVNPRMKLAKIFSSSLRPGAEAGNADRAQAGFTLLELMAVLVLMALLLGLVLPSLLRSWEREKNRATLRESDHYPANRQERGGHQGVLRCGCF